MDRLEQCCRSRSKVHVVSPKFYRQVLRFCLLKDRKWNKISKVNGRETNTVKDSDNLLDYIVWRVRKTLEMEMSIYVGLGYRRTI